MSARHALRQITRHERGMSLVELMVGITIGLFVVAAATLMVGNQLTDNRRLLLETQLQQDMRATMDIMTRQIRRAGALEPGFSKDFLASDSAAGLRNAAVAEILLPTSDEISFQYHLTIADKNFGFQLQSGLIRSFVGASGWQELTDPNAVKVTELSFAPISARESTVIPCPKLCPGGGRACWPTVQIRGYVVTLAAQAKSDDTVKRRMQSEVHVRNDFLKFNTGNPLQACPS